MGMREDIDCGVAIAMYAIFFIGVVSGIIMWELFWTLLDILKGIV